MNARAPRSWLAAPLALLLPGLGHVYAGRPKRGAAIVGFVLVAAPVFNMLAIAAAESRVTEAILALGGLSFLVCLAIDAALAARRSRDALSRRSRTLRCVGFFVAASIVLGFEQEVIHRWIAEPFRNPGESMSPALLPGDYFTVDKRAYVRDGPRAGDIVAFRRPDRAIFAKRVVGLPGDAVELVGDHIVVNGRQVPDSESHVRFPPTTVAPDQYFLVGDNGDQSIDSRQFGAVPLRDIIGRVVLIHFSLDPESHRVRWLRIGRAPGGDS